MSLSQTFNYCVHCEQPITLAPDGAWNDESGACGCGEGEHEPAPQLTHKDCLDHDDTCKGNVEYRVALSATGKSFPRCDHHWDERLNEQERINQRYPAMQPSNFDPSYAGESWYEDE